MLRRVAVALALAFASTACPSVAAHAFLDHATPAVGSAVREAPAQIKLWFTQRLEPAFSTVQVQDHAGKRVDKGDVQVGGADRDLMSVSVQPLEPGTYRVTWRVLSVDTHVSQGDFTFDIAP